MPARGSYNPGMIADLSSSIGNSTGNAPAGATGSYASIALDQGPDRLLSYRIPDQLTAIATVGQRVQVPLGKRNRLVTGTIVRIESSPHGLPTPARRPAGFIKPRDRSAPKSAGAAVKPANPGFWDGPITESADPATAEPALPAILDKPGPAGIKSIQCILDGTAPFSKELMNLAEWISRYYCCPPGQVLAGIMPAAVKQNTRIARDIRVALVGHPAERIAELLCQLSSRAKKSYQIAADQLAAGPVDIHAVVKPGGLTRQMLKRFTALGLLEVRSRAQNPAADGIAEAGDSSLQLRPVAQLTPDQTAAFHDILPHLRNPQFTVRLVFGVTGSGKTELYIRCIEQVLAAGRRAIVLLPEIALTHQAAVRFTARFERVAVLHSRMTNSLRHQHWQSIASGWAQVIVGARSAIFAPVDNLGLIIVDEEHDTSYKQDSAPRYHGRDVAVRRAQIAGIPVILGSATPSLESWENTFQNPHYKLLQLNSRPNNLRMPRVTVVNMREEHRQRRGLHALSTTMEFQLKNTLAAGGQAILLLNRRGYAHYLACAKCPWVMMCEHCDATMVVHLNRVITSTHDQFVKCHYCQTARILPDYCPDCRTRLIQLGLGTQRVEEELARKFPRARVARMDSDSMKKSADYRKTLGAFGSGELDILLGTQMIAKGLDFPNVRLVGVLNADLAMTSPDFRAAERTFDLVCQVAGRSGRADTQGAVIVQTMQPEEPAIVCAANHDYPGFVQSELPHRREFGYPPFGRIIRIIVTHKQADQADRIAGTIDRHLQRIIADSRLTVRKTGPQLPFMPRINDDHRREIMLFSAGAAPLQQLIAMLRSTGVLHETAGAVIGDVDPYSMA